MAELQDAFPHPTAVRRGWSVEARREARRPEEWRRIFFRPGSPRNPLIKLESRKGGEGN